MNYEEALSYLEGLNIFGIKLGLDRINRLLELLDLPQNRYRTIHVTGTNGKGSVSAMLAGILQHSGIHTGFYSSPASGLLYGADARGWTVNQRGRVRALSFNDPGLRRPDGR